MIRCLDGFGLAPAPARHGDNFSAFVMAVIAVLVLATSLAQTFDFTHEEQEYTVPAGITLLSAVVVGGRGRRPCGPQRRPRRPRGKRLCGAPGYAGRVAIRRGRWSRPRWPKWIRGSERGRLGRLCGTRQWRGRGARLGRANRFMRKRRLLRRRQLSYQRCIAGVATLGSGRRRRCGYRRSRRNPRLRRRCGRICGIPGRSSWHGNCRGERWFGLHSRWRRRGWLVRCRWRRRA